MLIGLTVADTTESAPKTRREKKEAFKIDFLTPSEKDPKALAKELFAPVTRGAGITLPGPSSGKTSSRKGSKRRTAKDKEKERRNDQTLPDDMHFSSRQLVTLFLKPQFSVRAIAHQMAMSYSHCSLALFSSRCADVMYSHAATERSMRTSGHKLRLNRLLCDLERTAMIVRSTHLLLDFSKLTVTR